jgi:putative AlgH/UPF0301 family transcriptional regulator
MSLAPSLLLSMPQLVDPNFARSVVLLCEHGAEGAFGLVVNRPSDVAAAVAVNLEPPLASPNDLPLLFGGPVDPQRGWILTSQVPEVDHRALGAGLYLGLAGAAAAHPDRSRFPGGRWCSPNARWDLDSRWSSPNPPGSWLVSST